MTKNPYIKHKHVFADWICSRADFDTFVTFTLKQGLPSNFTGTPILIDRSACEKTAMIFRDRVSQKLLGSGKARAGKRVPFAAFVEQETFKRTHLHMVLVTRTKEDDLTSLKMLVSSIASKLDWCHGQIDTRMITYGKPEFVVTYCLKTGTDAFLAEIAFLPE